MSEGNDIVIERAFDIEALSLFNCGVREIDQLIHKKQGGLLSFICEVPCEFYIIRKDESPIALFVLSNRTITVKDERYNSLEIDFIAVREDWRNKGIGTAILNIAEQNAREADFSFMTTAAFINKRYDASGFYEKCGFVKNGEKTGNTIPMYKYLQSTNP
ncbi:MAG: GNAT family N-acetyltransferase [Bacteroidales bacterium]|nr:GNAT family N-acetyltransferase [Bacteroidales bacterium]